MESLLIITGSMGAGKTAVLGEASDLLTQQHISHAAIDLDVLGLAHLPSGTSNDTVMYQNLHSVCQNYAAHGVERLLLARAMEDRAELELCRDIVPAAKMMVCRIVASVTTMEQRVEGRELGQLRLEYVARVAQLNAILDAAQLEDFTVTNENRSPTDSAQEMLLRAGWI